LCDHDITINFGIDAGEVILVDSCVMIVIYFVFKKQKQKTKELRYYSGTIQNGIFGEIRPRHYVS
jgi:hypothetical protein